MKKFDPAKAGFACPVLPLTTVPVHGAPWRDKLRNWWAGATIPAPTVEISANAKFSVEAVQRLFGDVDQLNEYYIQQTDYSRFWVRKLLGLSDETPVILDADCKLVARMFAHIGRHPEFRGIAAGLPSFVRKCYTVQTTEEGSLNGPNALKVSELKPVTSLFFDGPPNLAYPAGMETVDNVIDLTQFDNTQVVEQIRLSVQQSSQGGTTCGVIILPTVSESGRLMPVQEVAALVKELRSHQHNIFLVVDDSQGIGRRDADSLSNPLAYCDAYVVSASKALGGLLTASACVVSEELAQIFIEKVQRGTVQPSIAHFQFEPRLEAELPDGIFQRGAVSIPEYTALNAAFMYFYGRGEGDTFREKRLNQLALIEAERRKVVAAISKIDGVCVVEPSLTRPMVPSIVSFQINRAGVTPYAVRSALQQGSPIVTPAASVGSFMRLDIPEYRSVPSADVLADKLARVIAGLAKD